MCRFVVVRDDDVSVRSAVFGGTHPLAEQAWNPRELLVGHTNADGYGIVFYHEGRPIRIARREPIWYDPDLETLLGVLTSPTIVATVRNATPGMSSGAGGLAPLVVGEWCFVLNGFVEGFHESVKRELHRRLPDDLYRKLVDGSDSETLFLTALHAIRDGAGPSGALEHVIRLVRELVDDESDRRDRPAGAATAQLNMVLSGPRVTAVSRASTSGEANSLYRARNAAIAPGGTVIASEPLDQGTWEAVPNGTVLEIGADGDLRTVPLPIGGTSQDDGIVSI